ncbi:MAG: hypothetical protein E7270_01370 [Lachnospiraceae bacterium]|nr:hypothetical protein [Lachnospiraceae bacterium]
MSVETKSLGRKDVYDRFYTKHDIVDLCLSYIDVAKYDMIIEPSAGNGAFSSKIKNCKSYDIVPAADNIIKANWFELDKSNFSSNSLVIGNPPFGEQNSLSVNFFNEAATFCKTIAFILPKSFKKVSVQNRLNLYFHLITEVDLPENSFLLNNENYSVPCVFQIWERDNIPREKIKLKTTTDLFSFVDKESAKIRIPRVGGNAGKATLNLDGAKTSNYFIINNTELSDEQFVDFVNSLKFPSITYTVGPKSLSKGELIAIFEENYE